ncbi:hypothetical protein F5878DRAFT_640023 [Lentinula raphanica]|uniref:Uncharacterized protein n=1 Tax=Lentinula raphanica TaxID=153919 RepID=A0AA38PDD6_9AGAR|nr:hypothetical protein F5878DRAFT_640023 [Lentinula raphanica]
MPLQKPPRGYFHNADGYWLYILVRKNSLLRANFVLSLFRPKSYQQANLSVHDFFKFALMGRAGYGIVSKKDQFALIAPNELLPACGNAISFSVDKSEWQPSGTEPRKTETPAGQTVFSFERPPLSREGGSSRAVAGDIEGGTSEEGPGGGSGGRLHNFLKKTLVWVLQITQRSADAHNTRFNLFKRAVKGDVLAIAYYY